jgi:exodeoxyribonuclease-3
MVKIATWNVNSIKARLPNVLAWLKEAAPDVVLLQETKVVDEQFPRMEIEDLGYNVETAGQKTYNGVAILSKSPIEVDLTALPGDENDTQARYIEAFTGTVRVASIYLPNGNPVDTEKFTYKLNFMERLFDRAKELLENDEAFVLGGDYNVAPTDADVYDPAKALSEFGALVRPESRMALRKIVFLGLTDAIEGIGKEQGRYSFWDYQAGAWPRDNGIRIDHLLLSPQAADRLTDSGIDRGPRGKDKPSDHTPVWCELDG